MQTFWDWLLHVKVWVHYNAALHRFHTHQDNDFGLTLMPNKVLYLILINSKYALIWDCFENNWQSNFWGHQDQRRPMGQQLGIWVWKTKFEFKKTGSNLIRSTTKGFWFIFCSKIEGSRSKRSIRNSTEVCHSFLQTLIISFWLICRNHLRNSFAKYFQNSLKSTHFSQGLYVFLVIIVDPNSISWWVSF